MTAGFLGLALAGIIVETSFVPSGWAGFRPHLLLVLVILYAFGRGPSAGAACGFVAGLLEDLVSGGIVGVGVASLLITGYVAGILHRHIIAESRALALILVALLTVSQQVFYLLLLLLLGIGLPLSEGVPGRMLPVIATNVAIFAVIDHFRSRRAVADNRLFSQKVGG